jgi:hypothetical protein
MLAIIGVGAAGNEYRKSYLADTESKTPFCWYKVSKESNKHQLRAVTFVYFSLMELIHFFNYQVIDQPGFLN